MAKFINLCYPKNLFLNWKHLHSLRALAFSIKKWHHNFITPFPFLPPDPCNLSLLSSGGHFLMCNKVEAHKIQQLLWKPDCNAGGRSLVLLQLNVSDFVCFPWYTLPIGKSGWGMRWEEMRGQEEEWERTLDRV